MIDKLQKVAILMSLCSIGTGFIILSDYIRVVIVVLTIVGLNIVVDKKELYKLWIYLYATFVIGLYIADGSLMVNNVTKVLLIISYISFVICVIALSIEIIRRMLVGKGE